MGLLRWETRSADRRRTQTCEKGVQTMKPIITGLAAGFALLTLSTGAMTAAPTTAPSQTTKSEASATKTQTAQSGTTTKGPSRTGQPNQSCETTPNTPGNSASAPGSAFNPSGKAGTKYAGEQPQNSRNTASVSQYDAACAHQK